MNDVGHSPAGGVLAGLAFAMPCLTTTQQQQKGISCGAFKKQCFFPKLIISYCSDLKQKGDGLGKDLMWAAANYLKDRGITSFNGYMTEGGEDWKEAWYGRLSEAKIVLVMVSEMYWRSTNCIDELVTACRDKDSRLIIPVFLTLTPGSMMKVRWCVHVCGGGEWDES